MLRYDVVDVFTDRAYAGNPLAVVHGAEGLPTAAMQAIAAEFHLSETAFPLPPTTDEADYRVRIFTPARELPFAGHPSVGTAWVLARDRVISYGEVVQECGAGLLPVAVDSVGAGVRGGTPEIGPRRDGCELAATVGLTADDLDPDVVPGIAAAGIPFAFLPVRAPAVAVARPDDAAVAAATADTTGLGVVALAPGTAHLRMFGPQVGVPEDPATGSAAVALGVFLVDRGVLPADGTSTVTIAQGAEMGRPSRLEVTVTARGGVAVETMVQGQVVPIARGDLLTLP
ncbi:PhzF family phenazine biosynthesis protein [Pseudonocardia sp.]|uniref:PhzF family phenazine biosynthesis protein n=1 Tax=Pseudonocardia sp. TaxID=60912 RepID=UPI003D0F747F